MSEPSEADKAKARELCDHDHTSPRGCDECWEKSAKYRREAGILGHACYQCDAIVAALAQARAERDMEWWSALCLVDAVAPEPEAVKMWITMMAAHEQQRAREDGRREERRACWDVAERRRTAHAEYLLFAAAGQPRIDASTRASEAALVRDAISARGPMGPES